MTIEFKENQITACEEKGHYPFIGYFSPSGDLISYNNKLGGGYHGAWQNPVSWAFLSWVSYIILGTSVDDLIEYPEFFNICKYPGINEYVKRGYGGDHYYNYGNMDKFLFDLEERIIRIERNWKFSSEIDDYTRFEYDLLLFFRNAYKSRRFFDSIQKKIQIEDPEVIEQKLSSLPRYENCDRHIIHAATSDFIKEELLSHLKDICVQYLGYDSLERFMPNGMVIEIPGKYDKYQFDFLANKRVITSSYPNINERYYNYLLMDWVVHKLPRYYFNEDKGVYEEYSLSMFYQSETEEKLGKEIAAIKRLVPIKERKKYFR